MLPLQIRNKLILYNFYPKIFVLIRDRLEQGLDEIGGGLNAENGQHTALCLHPECLLVGSRICPRV